MTVLLNIVGEPEGLSRDAKLILYIGVPVLTCMVLAFGILWRYLLKRERKHDAREERHSEQTDQFIAVATDFKGLAADLKQYMNGAMQQAIIRGTHK